MNLKKIRAILDLILEYWGQTTGAVLGFIALILKMFGVINQEVFLEWVFAIIVVANLPKRIKNNKDEGTV
jgi:hypothetical protein